MANHQPLPPHATNTITNNLTKSFSQPQYEEQGLTWPALCTIKRKFQHLPRASLIRAVTRRLLSVAMIGLYSRSTMPAEPAQTGKSGSGTQKVNLLTGPRHIVPREDPPRRTATSPFHPSLAHVRLGGRKLPLAFKDNSHASKVI